MFELNCEEQVFAKQLDMRLKSVQAEGLPFTKALVGGRCGKEITSLRN